MAFKQELKKKLLMAMAMTNVHICFDISLLGIKWMGKVRDMSTFCISLNLFCQTYCLCFYHFWGVSPLQNLVKVSPPAKEVWVHLKMWPGDNFGPQFLFIKEEEKEIFSKVFLLRNLLYMQSRFRMKTSRSFYWQTSHETSSNYKCLAFSDRVNG